MNQKNDLARDYEEGQGEELYSKVIRAGRRTYFFDVKATKGNDYYLTITESRKKTGHDGEPVYEKHKLYLYKEDFAKFTDGIEDVISYVKRAKPEFFEQTASPAHVSEDAASSAKEAPLSIDEEFDKL